MSTEKQRKFTEITPLQALKLLADKGGEYEGFFFSDPKLTIPWTKQTLCGVTLRERRPFNVLAFDGDDNPLFLATPDAQRL